jgi:hypothetical protein
MELAPTLEDPSRDAFRVVSDDEWAEAVSQERVRGGDDRTFMTHILPSVMPGEGQKVDIMAFFAIPATLAYEIAAVVAGVVAADVVDNIIDRKFPEPRPPRGAIPQRTGAPADFQVAALPPIPLLRSLSPHRGVPG